MTRLGGLKSVSRRAKDPLEVLQNIETEDTDVAGTAPSSPQLPDFTNFLPDKSNLPESDMGGELTPQSYDVRANVVNKPDEKQEDNSGFWSSLGSALHDYVNPEKRQAMREQNQAMSQQAQSFSERPPLNPILQSLKDEASKPYAPVVKGVDAFSGALDSIKEGFTPKLDQSVYDKYPEMQAKKAQEQQRSQQLDHAELDKAQQNPHTIAVYGATDTFANQPELVEDFKEYTGLNFDDEEKALTEKYEKVLSDIEKGHDENEAMYDDQERQIKERILSNQSTEADKYYVGLALLMPLIIGGLFGKEAGLGALGGAAKGVSEVLGKRDKNIREDEESLMDIYNKKSANNLKKGELELDRLKIPEQVKKSMPKEEHEDLKGMRRYSLKDPKTGDVVAEGYEVLPGLVMKDSYGNTAKKREAMQKTASELAQDKAALERANQATADVVKAASQLKDPGFFGKLIAYGLSDDKNGALKKLYRQNAPEIMIDGRKQNAAVYIDSKMEQIKDAYRRSEQMRAYTSTVAEHIGVMAENAQYSGLKPEDMIDQMLNLRDRGQNFFVDRAEAQGFLREPLEQRYGKENKTLYKGLNRKEEKTQLERDKQLMHASE